MEWEVLFDEEFDRSFEALAEGLQDEIWSHIELLRRLGPNLHRPRVDTVKGVGLQQHEGIADPVSRRSLADTLRF